VPTIIAGVMFTYLFGSAGYLNEILHRLGAVDTPIDWLAGDWRSLGVILTAELWKVYPFGHPHHAGWPGKRSRERA
jgi:ABC-type sugar transport system permease subunit